MGTITFKVHPIPHLLEYMLAIIFKSIFDLFALDFSLHIFLLSISYMSLLEREKEISNDI